MAAIHFGLAVYACNLAVGAAARWWGARLGRWHHTLFALVVVSTLVAAAFAFHPALIVTLAALVAIPVPSARSWWHPALALVGCAGYLVAVFVPVA